MSYIHSINHYSRKNMWQRRGVNPEPLIIQVNALPIKPIHPFVTQTKKNYSHNTRRGQTSKKQDRNHLWKDEGNFHLEMNPPLSYGVGMGERIQLFFMLINYKSKLLLKITPNQ